MKEYLKGVLSGFIIFICSFIAPKETLKMIEYSRKWSDKLATEHNLKMYGRNTSKCD